MWSGRWFHCSPTGSLILGTWVPHTGAPCTVRALRSSPVSRSLTYVWIYSTSRRERCTKTPFLFSVCTYGRQMAQFPAHGWGQQGTHTVVTSIPMCTSGAWLRYWRTRFRGYQSLSFLGIMCRNSLLYFLSPFYVLLLFLFFFELRNRKRKNPHAAQFSLLPCIHGTALLNTCSAKII